MINAVGGRAKRSGDPAGQALLINPKEGLKVYKIKKSVIFFAAVMTAAALTACKETPTLPSTDNLHLVTTPARTSSTYTGTTVEYVPSTSAAQRRNSPNMPDMPDFPDMDMGAADNPFDSDFYALFGNNSAEYPDFSAAPEDDSGDHLPASETSVPFAEPDDISISREDVPDEAMTNMTEPVTARVETAFPGAQMPDFTFSYPVETTVTAVPPETLTTTGGTFPQTEPFDIREYMPSMEDFPDFGDIEFDTADFGR